MFVSLSSARVFLNHHKLDKNKMFSLASITVLVMGCILFSISCWQFYKQMKSASVSISIPTNKQVATFPSDSLINELVWLYRGTDKKPLASSNTAEQFRVNDRLPSDDILLAAPLANLNEKVVGILMSSGGQLNMAIIESANKQASYTVGDLLAKQFTIVKIFPDRVIIDNKGLYARLMLTH